VSNPIRSIRGVNRRALHLLWTVPLAALVSLPLVFLASISLCGISGCTGGGFGVDTDYESQTWVFVGVIGLLFFLAIRLPAWLYPVTWRVIVAVVVAVSISGALTLNYVSQLRFLPH
jgi:hypothetical protein